MRNAVAPQAHRRHERRIAFRRWQATHVGTPSVDQAEADASPDDDGEEEADDVPAWPRRAARAVVDNVRAHPVAWLLGAAGVGAGCALLAHVLRKKTQPRRAHPVDGDESLALACRMDCAVLPASELPSMPLGVQVIVTLLPLVPPV